MERTATLNGRFRTRLATLVVAAMVAPMLGALAAPARATTGPSATLSFSFFDDTFDSLFEGLVSLDQTVEFTDGERYGIFLGASIPGSILDFSASLETTLTAGTTASLQIGQDGIEFLPFEFDAEDLDFANAVPIACTDIWEVRVEGGGGDDGACPIQPWLDGSTFADIDVSVETVADSYGAYLIPLELIQDGPDPGTGDDILIADIDVILVIFPYVLAAATVDGVASPADFSGLSSTVQRGSSVTVDMEAWTGFTTDVVTLSASPPGGPTVTDQAALDLCDELFGGAGTCPFGPFLGDLDGTAPSTFRSESESGTIAADAQYGSWTFTLDLWAIFDDGTEFDCPAVGDCELSSITVVFDVERPAEAARSSMVLDAGGLPPSVAPGDVRYRMLGEAPVALPTTRVSSPTGVSAVGGDVGIVVVGDRSSSAVGPVTDARGGLTVTLNGPIPEGAVVEVWMASEPRLVAAGRSDGSGSLAIVVPVAAPLDGQGEVAPGAHTLQAQVPLASGVAVFDVGVTVGGPVPTSVPSGLAPSSSGVRALSMGMLAVVAMLIGSASVGTTRHRRGRSATID